jgi:hypothetical protein
MWWLIISTPKRSQGHSRSIELARVILVSDTVSCLSALILNSQIGMNLLVLLTYYHLVESALSSIMFTTLDTQSRILSPLSLPRSRADPLIRTFC